MIQFIIIFLFSNILLSDDSYNMQLLGYLPYNQSCSDITGFYQDGREFAVIGLQNATSFVDITDPYNPYEIDQINGSNSIWRDLKYWDRHVYIGTEANDGIKVVSVDDPDNPVVVNTITDVDNSHNIHVDLDGYLYIVGADTYDVWIYSLDDPANPQLVGNWTTEYCHDIEVYNDKLYCAAIYTGNFYIVDVSDKTNPVTVASHFTGTSGISTHDVAVTEDENYLFTGDENLSGHIKVWDISNYNNINLVDEYQTPNGQQHTSHNLYVRPGADQLIISYYADGTRVLDISDPTNLTEIAFYDMSDTEGLYVSNWGTYAYLPSGYIISSDIEQGLYILEVGGVSITHDPIEDLVSESITIQAVVESFDGNVQDVNLFFSYDNESWNQLNMVNVENNIYSAIITPSDQGIVIYYYITASNDSGQSSSYPFDTDEPIMFIFGELPDVVVENFEEESGWYEESDASSGIWELVVPNPTYDDGVLAQTNVDHTEDGEKCYVTGNDEQENNSGQDDVDGGSTILYSPIFNLSNYDDVLVTYWRWYTNNLGNNPGNDIWQVQVSNGNNNSWIDLENTNQSNPAWERVRFVLGQYIELTETMQFRYIASDLSNPGDGGSGGSLIEAALDDFSIGAIAFDVINGDINLDGEVNILDVVTLVNVALGFETSELADLNQDGEVNVIDVVLLVNLILED